MTITPDLLEIFQQPPMPHETDVGAVDPFTPSEMASIACYQDATAVIPDCLDGVFLSGAEVLKDMSAIEASRYIEACIGWLNEWHDALDTLHGNLSCNEVGTPYTAADRLLSHQARAMIEARDKVYAAIICYMTGTCGPQLTDGALALSNGYVHLRP